MSQAIPSKSLIKRSVRWAPRLVGVEFALQLALAVVTVLAAAQHYRAVTQLQTALAEQDRFDRGWRLQEIEAARAAVPDEQNSALVVQQTVKLLPKGWLEDPIFDEVLSLSPERRMTPDGTARLRRQLDGLRPAVEEARRLADLPHGRFPITYARIPEGTLLTGRQNARHPWALLKFDATACAEAGDAHQAMASCRGAMNAGRSIGDEPFAISQLIRLACTAGAQKTAERVLAQTEPDDADLLSLQTLVQDEAAHPYLMICVRGERAVAHGFLDALESGDVKPSEINGVPAPWDEQIFPFIFEDGMRSTHPMLFEVTDRLQTAAAMPYPQARPVIQQIDKEIRRGGGKGGLSVLPAFSVLADAFARSQSLFNSAAAALAAERYRRKHGDWPDSLDRLTPDLLSAVPSDPFTGEPLHYHRLPDGVVVYGVGQDGVDDGGNVDVPDITEPGTDVGVRLWDVAKRRQPPAPPH